MKKIKSNEEIQSSIIKISKEINNDFKGEEIDLIALNDSPKYFINDFIKFLNLKFRCMSLNFNNYDEKTPSGEVKILKDLEFPIHGRNIILVDGIIVTGTTHLYISKYLKQRSPKSISLLTVGIKRSTLIKEIPKNYSLFKFNNEWVEGYGFGSDESKRKKYLIDLNQL